MSKQIDIKQLDHRTCTVNGKRIEKDMDGIWVSKIDDLSDNEIRAFQEYLLMQKLSFKNRLN